MTDRLSQPSAELASTQPAAPNQTAGQLIRAARIAKGMHTALLSVTLKVPVRQLEALEADQYDAFKGPVFVRALASSVCRQLQLDAAPVLALLPPSADRLPSHRPSLEPLTSEKPMHFGRLPFLRSIPIQTVSIAVLMLALIAALLWMPSPSTWSWFQSEPKAPAVVEQPMAVPEPVLPEPVPAAQPQTSEPVAAVQAPAAAVSVASAAPAVTVASVPVAATAPATKASSGAVLGFSATNDSWIEIRSSKNQVLWSRVVHAGERVEVQYPLPLNVVVGRASAVRMTYKGQPFDLAPHTKVTVARFEVKE